MPNAYSPYGGTSSDHTIQKLVLGTHTSNDEQNYLQIVSVSAHMINYLGQITTGVVQRHQRFQGERVG